METLKAINSGLAFLLELAMLAALGYWGFSAGNSVPAKWILGIGLPLLAALLWSIFLAPRAVYRLNRLSGNLLSLILFLLAAALLFFTHHPLWASIFALIAVLNRALMLVWKQW